jgi:hypothetical protein
MNLKLQLGEFDRYFSLHLDDGMRLYAHQPVLKLKDVNRIVGKLKNPEKNNTGESYKIHLRQLYRSTAHAVENKDIPGELKFRSGKLSGVYLLSSSLVDLDESFIVSSLHALGNSDIQKRKKLVTGTVHYGPETPMKVPTYSDITAVLGTPYSIKSQNGDRILRFRYSIESQDGNEKSKKLSIYFTYSGDGVLKQINGKLKGFRIRILYERIDGS